MVAQGSGSGPRAGKQWPLPFSSVYVCAVSMHRALGARHLERKTEDRKSQAPRQQDVRAADRVSGFRKDMPVGGEGWGVLVSHRHQWTQTGPFPGPGLRGVGHAFPGSERCTPGGCGLGHGKQKTKVALGGGGAQGGECLLPLAPPRRVRGGSRCTQRSLDFSNRELVGT